MPSLKVLTAIRNDLESYVGNRIRLRTSQGRSKTMEGNGVLEKTYPNIFIVRLDQKKASRLVSFSYSDLLIEVVELTILDNGDEIKIEGVRTN